MATKEEAILANQAAIQALCDKVAAIPPVPAQEICTGPFVKQSSRTGWWTGWAPVVSNGADYPNTISDWYNVGSAVTSPQCLTDVSIAADPGRHYVYSRRVRTYIWLDWRLLVNGAPVLTRTFDDYWYHDERSDTAPDVIEPLQTELVGLSPWNITRANIPAGATLQVQALTRVRTVAAQASSWWRYIGGLRSDTTHTFLPRTIVTGRQP